MLFGLDRPAEEFYDLNDDLHEIRNLANDPQYAIELKRHCSILHRWMRDTDDRGQYPESDADLLAVLKQYGRRCVNPEYDRVRHLLTDELNTKKP